MASKAGSARMATTSGENVIIASGREPGALKRICGRERRDAS